MKPQQKILFICTGNICRSPSAEAILRQLAEKAGLPMTVDSAGTGDWHSGEAPDKRATRAVEKRGYSMAGIIARQVTRDDINTYDRIYAMTREHEAYLHTLANDGNRGKILLFLPATAQAHTDMSDVPDPYYGGEKGFEQMMDLLEAGCKEIIRQLGQPG